MMRNLFEWCKKASIRDSIGIIYILSTLLFKAILLLFEFSATKTELIKSILREEQTIVMLVMSFYFVSTYKRRGAENDKDE